MKHQRRLDRLVAQRTPRPTKPAETKLVIPNIIDFVTGKDYLNQPNLYPRQALLLKLICLSPELLSAYDRRVLEQWGAGFTAVGEPGARRYAGTEGLPPDVLQRMELCREEGRRWFGEVVLVLGRRAGKGYLTALVAAYVLWCFMATGDPQAHFGIDRHKRLSGMFFAGELTQSSDNLFRDVRQLVGNAPCFAPYVATDLLNRMLICSPADLRRTGRPAVEAAHEASFVLDARPTTSLAGRGPAAFMVVFDEMAHLGVATARSADEVYEAAVPALDQFDKDAVIIQASSPASQQGKFYARYQDALALTDEDIAVNPTLLTVQLPSWAPYEDWELTGQPGGLEMYAGGPPFQPIRRAVITEVAASRREADDPYRFAVERRAQWAVSFRAFLDRDLVDAIFQDLEETPLVQPGVALDTEYLIHVDPSTNRANYAIVVAHRRGPCDGSLPHVVIDEITVSPRRSSAAASTRPPAWNGSSRSLPSTRPPRSPSTSTRAPSPSSRCGPGCSSRTCRVRRLSPCRPPPARASPGWLKSSSQRSGSGWCTRSSTSSRGSSCFTSRYDPTARSTTPRTDRYKPPTSPTASSR